MAPGCTTIDYKVTTFYGSTQYTTNINRLGGVLKLQLVFAEI